MVIRVGLDRIRARIKAAAITVIKELGEAFENSIEEKLTTMSDMRTWIRCGASNVYDGWLTNTYFVIRAVGGELVVTESLDSSRSDGATIARIPVEAPNSVSDLEQVVRTTIIRNVQRDMACR